MTEYDEFTAWEKDYYAQCTHYDCGVYYITHAAGEIRCTDGTTCMCASKELPSGAYYGHALRRQCSDRFNIECSHFRRREEE